MDAQSARLVDPTIVGLVKLHVDGSFPFASTFTVVACVRAVGRIVMDAGNEDASLVIEERQRISSDGESRHPVGVTTQRMDEVAVGRHSTDATVIFVEHRCPNHNAVSDTVDGMIDRRNAIDDGINVGGGIQRSVQSQRLGIKARGCCWAVAIGGIADVMVRVEALQAERKTILVKSPRNRKRHLLCLGDRPRGNQQ